MDKVIVLRKGDGKLLLEGDELTEIYCKTDKLSFAVSTLLPGHRASVDAGHKEADEVCFVAQGELAIQIPGTDEVYYLRAGDALLIPPAIPHFSVNVGEEKSVAIWACAPRP